jgi:hypothetical protein
VNSVLVENLIDFYLTTAFDKELWDALETKYGVSDAGVNYMSWNSYVTIRWSMTVL